MADMLRENDDDELIIVETDEIPTPEQINAEAPADLDDDNDADDDVGEDARLSDEDDDEDDDESPNRKKRLKRRQVQKQAKEKTLQELRLLRQQNEDMARRLAAVEGNALSQSGAQLEQRLLDVQREVQQAELIIARAIESGNGDDVTTALNMRDEAKARESQLYSAKTQVEYARTQPAAADPRVTSLGQQWMEANPWYDPRGANEDSAITNAIDNRLVSEGYNPATVEYWEELTRRVSARINRSADRDDREDREDRQTNPRKKAPPMGNSREHAPTSTKKEVYVTPERKQAMMDAGVWDDPVKRNQMLKAYQAYDRNPPR